MRFLLLLLALLPVAAVAQIETPGTGGGGGGGGGPSTPYYGPFTNTQIYGVNTNALRISSGVITSSLPAIDISQTWSNSGVTFIGNRFAVTNSSSAAGSAFASWGYSNRLSFEIRPKGVLIQNPAYANDTYSPGWYSSSLAAFEGALTLMHRNTWDLGDGYWKVAVNRGGVYVNQNSAEGHVFAWRPSDFSAADLSLDRDAAATLQLGADAATATAQTIKAHDGSGTDKAGANLIIASGKGTGAGISGELSFKTAIKGGSGSSLNSYTTREWFSPNPAAQSDSAFGTLFTINGLPSGGIAGVDVFVTTYAENGADRVVNTDQFNMVAHYNGTTTSFNLGTNTMLRSSYNSAATTMETSFQATDNGSGSFTIEIKPTMSASGYSTINSVFQLRINSPNALDVSYN